MTIDNLNEDFLDNIHNFPDKLKKEASQAIANSFKNPEIPINLSHTDRNRLLDVLSGVVGTRQELFVTYDSVRLIDTVQTILNVIINDTFYSNDGEDIFTVKYDEGNERESDTQKKVNDLIGDFLSDFNIQSLIQCILEDFLLYGEYPIRVVISKNNKGIIDIREDLDPRSTVGIYKLNEPVFFLERTDRSHTSYVVRSPKEVIHFSLSPTKIRVKSFDYFMRQKNIPEYIRIGKSIIYPALQKIKQLQTIEIASTVSDLKRAIAPILVSVSVPPTAQPEDVTEIVKKYEQHLQEVYRGMPDLENPSIGDLLSTVTNFRVVPNFTDGKGAIQTLDLMSNQMDIDNRIDRMRASIAMSVGMPPYYLITGAEGNGSKTEMLKVHSRYSRNICAIHNAISAGVKKLVYLHVINSGVYVDDALINVKFKNVINVEHLDKMEYAVASAQTINDVWNTLSSILASDEVGAKLNSEAFVGMVNTFLSAGTPVPQDLLQVVKKTEQQSGNMSDGGGGGGVSGASFGSGGGSAGMGDMGGGEADLYGGSAPGPDAGNVSADAMQNTQGIPPADFGDAGDVEGLEPDTNLADTGDMGDLGDEELGMDMEEAPEPDNTNKPDETDNIGDYV